MKHKPLIAVVCGSFSPDSRTRVLLNAIARAVSREIPAQLQYVELADLTPEIGRALSKKELSISAMASLGTIEDADALIVGAPVFRGGLPGLFKHLFDLIDQRALEGKPVLLAATGGSDRHALVLDHQWRPLFAFFQALTLPVGVYATPADIQHGAITSPALAERISLAVRLALPSLLTIANRDRLDRVVDFN
ncbi:NAD(P)H-dependent oxidoreductase [Achromobacter marplatensis]|uniref:NAD(P)H-dependent oxidoreductase n=1 Tax=Achromobacter marplatensis TaxID=470868 RepID=UPI0028EFC641|nr:NAD(P)H-dependent oxidoreductase [Achromobacter marplatensis]